MSAAYTCKVDCLAWHPLSTLTKKKARKIKTPMNAIFHKHLAGAWFTRERFLDDSLASFLSSSTFFHDSSSSMLFAKLKTSKQKKTLNNPALKKRTRKIHFQQFYSGINFDGKLPEKYFSGRVHIFIKYNFWWIFLLIGPFAFKKAKIKKKSLKSPFKCHFLGSKYLRLKKFLEKN